jgi:hypothetical protein
MATEKKDMPRTDVGKEGGMPKHDDGGKSGELGKQGGDWKPGEKKEWEKPEVKP